MLTDRTGSTPTTTAFARASAVVAFALALAVPGSASADVRCTTPAVSMPLRVLTYNVFGIPQLSPAIEERMAAIGPAMVRLAPDVILLQEIWRDADAGPIAEALRSAGFVAVRSFGSQHWLDRGRGGLMIASKLAIVAERFDEFEAGTLPHIPWHVDWHGGKGAFAVRLATPVGEIGVIDVHAQASYATGHYEGIRVAQALEIASSIASPGSIVRPDQALVIGGDVNASPRDPSTQLLAALTDARIADTSLGPDVVMARSGADVSVTIRSTERVLTEPLRLADGTFVPLSDHEGVLVELELRRCEALTHDPEAPPLASAVAAARAELDAERSRSTWFTGLTAVCAAGSAWLAVRAGRTLPRRRRRAERALVAAFVLWALFWAGWWTYTAFVFGPHHLGTIDRAAAALADPSRWPTRRAAPP